MRTNVDAGPLEDASGPARHLATQREPHEREPPRDLAAEVDVAGRIEIVGQSQVLVHGLDAGSARGQGRMEADLLARAVDDALVGADRTRQYLHQSALSRAVVSHQRDTFARG